MHHLWCSHLQFSDTLLGKRRHLLIGIASEILTATRQDDSVKEYYMSREIDVRDYSSNRLTPQRAAMLQTKADVVSAGLQDVRGIRVARINATTGNASLLTFDAPALAGTSNDFTQRALRYVQAASPAFGLADTQAPEFLADPAVPQTSTGARAVNLQQRYKGIPIFEAATIIRFSPDGKLEDAAGNLITVAVDVSPASKITVANAVLKAAEFVNRPEPDSEGRKDQFGGPLPDPIVDLSGFAPKVRVAFPNTPEQPTVLDAGPFGAEIKTSLVWFPRNDSVSLGWTVLLTFPNYERQYLVVVDANSGEILYSHQTVQYVVAAGNVYRVNGGSPRQMTSIPPSINDYGVPFPATGQENWRWCHKCQGLYFSGGKSQGVCPAGTTHDHTGSGNYLLAHSVAVGTRQESHLHGWT
jgi:extracellular elastinolytic metalloproteinase